jgi:serine/threonine protein kinase
MIMEYVEGVSMATHLSGAPIPVADAINYIDQVLNALGYAHEHTRHPSRHQAGQHDADSAGTW